MSTDLAASIKDRFAGRRIPPWLLRFAAEPHAALPDLLLGRAALGHLDAAEPADVLLDWLRFLDDDFALAVDAALAEWMAHHWGDTLPPGCGGHASLSADAWVRAADLIMLEPRLSQAAGVLRQHLLADRQFLDSLRESRANDPQSRAWLALARHQNDRSLLPEWWNLCRLPPDQPWYRGACAIHGLLYLPPEKPQATRGFDKAAAEGLLCLGTALWQRQREGWLKRDSARDEWLGMAQVAERTLPFPERWQSVWHNALNEARCQDWGGWIRTLHSNLGKAKGSAHLQQPDPHWGRRAIKLVERLKNGEATAITEAEDLLREELRYAQTSGDADPFARSAVVFSNAARRQGWLKQALDWAERARQLDPWNAHAWTNTVTCLQRLQQPQALTQAVATARRFPDNVVASNGLAEVLKAQDRLEEAEAQYRQTLGRFPDNVVASTGLAEVLKAQDRLEEAEAQYRQTLARFPNDAYARTGLTSVLKAQGKAEVVEVQNEPVHSPVAAESAAHDEVGYAVRTVQRCEVRTAYPTTPPPSFRHGLAEPRNRDVDGSLSAPSMVMDSATNPSGTELPFEEHRVEQPDVPPCRSDEPPGANNTPNCQDVQTLTADAYLLRNWRRATQQNAAYIAPGRMRERAERLLQQLLECSEQDSLAASTAALLELDAGDLQLALDLLRKAAQRFPGSARVRYALARAERAAGLASATSWKRLARLDSRLQAVALLGEARACMADSAPESAVDALGALGHWLTPHLLVNAAHAPGGAAPFERSEVNLSPVEIARNAFAAPEGSFTAWWAVEVQAHLFGAMPVNGAENLPSWESICANVATHASALDCLEEDYLGHFAAA